EVDAAVGAVLVFRFARRGGLVVEAGPPLFLRLVGCTILGSLGRGVGLAGARTRERFARAGHLALDAGDGRAFFERAGLGGVLGKGGGLVGGDLEPGIGVEDLDRADV